MVPEYATQPYHDLFTIQPDCRVSSTPSADDNRAMPRTILLEFLRAASGRIEQAIMPRRCVFCGTCSHDDEALICPGCHDDLPWNDCCCARCAQPVGSPLPPGVDCAGCQAAPPPVRTTIAPLIYAFPADAAIKSLKFHRKLFYVPAFGEILVRAFARLPSDIDALLPVPLHWRRHLTRGYNQARELCNPLLETTGLPLVSNIVRQRATAFQSGLSGQARRANLHGAFCVRGEIPGRHVLIIDDVITTGTTCRALATVLLQAGVDKVSVLALARAARPGRQSA